MLKKWLSCICAAILLLGLGGCEDNSRKVKIGVSIGAGGAAPYQTTRLVFDNNLLALQSVSLSYELPRKISQKMYMERVKLLLSSTDLFRLSSVKQERGTSYPFARTFSIGLNVTF